MPDENKWAKKYRSREKYMSPESLPIKYKEHEEGDSRVSREEKIILGIVEEIIEKESDILISEDNLVWVNPEVSKWDEKGSNRDKEGYRLNREEDILWIPDDEQDGDECENEGARYDETIDIQSWYIVEEDIPYSSTARFDNIFVGKFLECKGNTKNHKRPKQWNNTFTIPEGFMSVIGGFYDAMNHSLVE